MLDQAQTDTICAKLSTGFSLRAICREMELSESNVRFWLRNDEEAAAQTVRAREHGCDALADECIEIADTPGDPADKRVRIDTRIRLIGKWSQRYSDKLAITNNTTVTHKHDLGSLDTADLEQLETILAKSERGQGGIVAPEPAAVH